MLEKKMLNLLSHPQSMENNPNNKSRLDINFFRKSVSFHYQNLYAEKKWQNSLYRFVFYGFSFLFFLLGILIFFKTINPMCSLYLGNCSVLKNGVNTLCGLLSMGSFIIGYHIHPEKEAIKHLFKKLEADLSGPAKQIQIEFNAIMANLSHSIIE